MLTTEIVSLENNIYQDHCNKDNDKRDNRSVFKLQAI